jgi:predicted permease
MEALWTDVRYALRQLARERAFSAVVLLTLAVCIAANVAVFSVVSTVVLRPLPYPAADRIVTIYNSYPEAGAERASNSGIDYFLRRERVDALESVAVYQGSGHTVGEAGSTERIETMRVSATFFPLLGIEPALGRTFTEEENDGSQAEKAILTHGFWQERFGGRPDAIGRELRVDGRPFTVVGVLPEDFRLVVQPGVRFFVPIAFTENQRTIESWHSNNFQMIGRLEPGATVEQATEQIAALNNSLVEESPIPNVRQLVEDVGFHTVVVDARQDLVREVRPFLYLLWAGAAFVLVIGCVNVANLMLARAHGRAAELATRLALGARRARLVRQILTEATVVAFVSAGLGLILGALGLRALADLGLDDLPRGAEVAIDAGALVFTVGLAIGAALVFGMIPALHTLRSDLQSVFREEGRSGTASRGTVILRSGLVASQVALAFVLLMGAGLMVRSFRAAAGVDPGFEPDRVLTAAAALPVARYPDADARRRFTDELLAQLRALPGVEAAAVATDIPFSGDYSSSVIFPEGWEPTPGSSVISPFQTVVSPGYFEAMGIELLEGRAFLESDGPEATNVLVIDERLARKFWPDRSPIGARMVTGHAPGDPDVEEDDYYTVIGVVRSVQQMELTALDQVGAYYGSARQTPFAGLTVVIRTATDATTATAATRAVLAQIDPELPLYDVRPMAERVARSLASRRAAMALLGVFGGVALFLAVVGIYGVLAYAVAQRTREVGIRMAMGSSSDAIFRLILRQGLAVTAIGLAAGGAASLGLGGLIRSMLFGVTPTDPGVMVGVALVLGAVASVACALPAWRATHVDPVVALHGD